MTETDTWGTIPLAELQRLQADLRRIASSAAPPSYFSDGRRQEPPTAATQYDATLVIRLPFWLDAVERLTLLHRITPNYDLYGVQCPHGARARRLVLGDERLEDWQQDEDIRRWSKRAVEHFPCECQFLAHRRTLAQFCAATPNWEVEV